MRIQRYWLAATALTLPCHAARIAHEPFEYAAASSLTAQGGGSGWSAVWHQDGGTAHAGSVGLGYTDSLGNVLNVSGLCADTTGSETTRSFRVAGASNLNNVWISFLYQLPAPNAKFEGVSFYRGTQSTFSVSNPGSSGTAAIYLTSNLTGGASVNTGRGTFGRTHLVVLKLTKGGGAGGTDRVEAFIDPNLTGSPSSPAPVDGANFDFDRVRIAAQDGTTLFVDELRIGDSFADVTPHLPAGGADTDNDGLSDSQESVLGLDPNVSDAALIAGIQAHPEWFDLFSASEIMNFGNGGVVLQQAANDPVSLIFEVQHSETLTEWGVLETINRRIELPAGKNFLRLTLQHP